MLTRDDKEHASRVWFPLASVVHSSLSFDLGLTIVINHEKGVGSTMSSDLPGNGH